MKRWYVINTHSRSEGLALANLSRQGFEAYLPCYLKRRRHARRTDTVSRPLFPGYLFVFMDLEVERWYAVKSTIGVKYVICHGDAPAPVPFGVVEEIQAHEDGAGKVVMGKISPFKKNDMVQIKDGAFLDQIGIFDCATDEERVFVLLDLMGRQVRVRMPLEAISAYA